METKKARLLFVEDDVNLRFVTQDNLEEKGFEVTCCGDGVAALDLFKEQTFDLCILDVMLPEKDGFTLAKEIRAMNRDVPILFLTAKSLKEDRIQGLKLGGDDYITKPFSMEELALKIEIFLKRSKITTKEESPTTEFTIGDYTFDYANLELQHDKGNQRLTQKEADLLRMFCVNKEQILKREEILTAIWGDDDYFLGRSLDVFIFRLRKYLKKDASLSIQNIHGVGFKFSTKE